MSKTFVHRTTDLYKAADVALSGAACVSASLPCAGFSTLLGGVLSNSSTLAAASGVRIYQSIDGGVNWDILSASNALTADTALTVNIPIVGDYVQFVWRNGATAASGRAHLYLIP